MKQSRMCDGKQSLFIYNDLQTIYKLVKGSKINGWYMVKTKMLELDLSKDHSN